MNVPGIPGIMSAEGYKELGLDSGAYLNEVYSFLQPTILQSASANYRIGLLQTNQLEDNVLEGPLPKLSAITTKYDPKLVFWASPDINADHMEIVDGRLCAVSEARQRVMGANSSLPLMGSN
jgi:hypothetical protein